jgi:hypothetical protein
VRNYLDFCSLANPPGGRERMGEASLRLAHRTAGESAKKARTSVPSGTDRR